MDKISDKLDTISERLYTVENKMSYIEKQLYLWKLHEQTSNKPLVCTTEAADPTVRCTDLKKDTSTTYYEPILQTTTIQETC